MCLGVNWISEIMVQFCYLLYFSQRCELLSWKAAFIHVTEFFAAINNWWQQKLQSQAMSLWTTETYKADRNQPITNQWPFKRIKFCLLRHRLRWLRATKNANVSWLLNFRIPMFLKSAAILYWGIETVSCHLLLWMTRMDMDWKLKNVSQLFNF